MTTSGVSIGIIDYGMGNIGSVSNALTFLGISHHLLACSDDFPTVDGLILPGVGSFGSAMQALESRRLIGPLEQAALRDGKPFLGICLGMQVLAEGSEESPGIRGLGWIRGTCGLVAPDKLDDPAVRRPHVGWNRTVPVDPADPLFTRLPGGAEFYFDHTFALEGTAGAICAVADYHGAVPAAVRQDNLEAVQFHPEKSQTAGLILLRNFTNRVRAHTLHAAA